MGGGTINVEGVAVLGYASHNEFRFLTPPAINNYDETDGHGGSHGPFHFNHAGLNFSLDGRF